MAAFIGELAGEVSMKKWMFGIGLIDVSAAAHARPKQMATPWI